MVDEQDTLVAVLKHDLGRFLPLRIILRNEDGVLKGLTEESFCMAFDTSRVRVWWSGKAYSLLGEHIINGADDAKSNAKPGDLIFDPLLEDCPIEVDWAAWRSATRKYEQRNAPFKLKVKHEATSIQS
jgi:hypothetical protein